MAAETTIQGGASPYRWWMLILGSIVEFFVAGMAWSIMPVLFQEIAQPKDIGLGLTLVQLGAIWGMMPLAMALLAIPSGIAADRYGIRWIIGFGVLLTAVAGALRGMSGDFTSLLIWMFLFGVGYALLGTNIPKFLGVWFKSKELGMANGIVFSCYALGGGFAIQFGGAFFSPAVGGWRNVLYILGIISLVLGIMWLITVKTPKTSGGKTGAAEKGAVSQQGLFHGLVVGFRTRDVWLLAVCQMLYLGGYLGALGYLPMYLTERGMSKAMAHGYLSLILYLGVVGKTLVPMISDWLGTRKYAYAVSISITGICLMLVPFTSGTALLALLGTWGICTGGYVIPRIIPPEHPRIGPALTGSVFGFMTTVGFIGGFLSPITVNAIAAKSGGAPAIVLCSSFLLVAALIFLFVTETHPKRAPKVGQAS